MPLLLNSVYSLTV